MPKTYDFRQRATDCFVLSERSPVPRHKELFLRMGQRWLSLAERERPQSLPESDRPASHLGPGKQTTSSFDF
jgi:hypothetical protein